MTWNWGTGIFFVIVLFLGACAAFFIYSQGQRWSLVEEDYYPKELRHEEKLVKMRNAFALSESVKIVLDSLDLQVKFPPEFRGRPITGKIDIYRPSDEKLDILLPVTVDTSMVQNIPLHRLTHGRYIVRVDWASTGTSYLTEQDIFIP